MFTLTLWANQNPFILTHDGLIDQRAQDKIFQIGSETKSKLNVNLYVSIEENNGIDMDKPIEERRKLMKLYEQKLLKDVKRPYVLLSLVIDQKYANILMSDDLKNVVNKDDVLDDYVIPLLASKDKNSLFAKTSAASLNGFAQIADSIAQSKNIKLESSIGSEGKTAGTVWRVFMYTLVAAGILLYALIILREKKFKNGK
eukprot:Anaeramoba_ignava/a608912_68.p1 GENE.a608912_68~~a608912_68.p1  ORF type:complete len:200 (+),score=-2.28 a608912_68:672-1271(+)